MMDQKPTKGILFNNVTFSLYNLAVKVSSKKSDEYDPKLIYEGSRIVDYPDLLSSIKFDWNLAKIEHYEDIDDKFLEKLNECNNRGEMWRSTLIDKINNFEKIDKYE